MAQKLLLERLSYIFFMIAVISSLFLLTYIKFNDEYKPLNFVIHLKTSNLFRNGFMSAEVYFRELFYDRVYVLVDDVRRALSESSLIHHKDLFPLNERDIWGSIFVGLGTMIAASGGIGGGGILVPLLILVFDFHPKHAIALSNFTIVGSSLTNMALNLSKRHPNADRPLVDWNLILVMEPLTMAGAVVGAILSKVLPDWLLVISLVILLAYTTKTTLDKGFSLWRKESKQFELERKSELNQAAIAIEESNQSLEMSSLLHDSDDDDVESNDFKAMSGQLAQLLEQERHTPRDKVSIIIIMVTVVLLLNLLKGGGANFPSPLGVTCGSLGYWAISSFVFIWIIGISLYCRSLLIKEWKVKKSCNYQYGPGDIEWNETNTILYPSICFFAGLAAGLFGVGGGIVKGPLMLYMGVNPLVASGTVAVMIMFTSVAATTIFIAFGILTWDYAIYLFIIGLLTTVIGQYVVSYFVVKYRRVSLVSLSIGAVVALSTVLLGVQSIFNLVDIYQGGGEGESTSLCKN